MNDLHVSSGPVSSMPGSNHELPPGSMCDDHPTVPAVRRIQGETDSFGCEYHMMCQACLDEHRKHLQAARDEPGCCDWCSELKTGLRPRRDYEEGMAGPVYRVCGDCIKKENEEAQEELDRYGNHYI